MNANDPILVPDVYFTKQKVVDQLEDASLSADALIDEDAMWWVEQEDYIRFEAISYGEDFYGRKMAEVNAELVRRMTS